MSTDNENWDPPEQPDRKEFPAHSEGTHRIVLADAVRLGLSVKEYEGKKSLKDTVALIFQSEELRDDGKPFELTREFTYSPAPNAHLPGFLKAFGAKVDTEEERARAISEIPSYVGRSVLGTVERRVSKKGRTYAKLASTAPLMKDQAPLTVKGYTRGEWVAEKKAQYAEEVAAYKADLAKPASPKAATKPTDFSDVPPAVADDETDLPF